MKVPYGQSRGARWRLFFFLLTALTAGLLATALFLPGLGGGFILDDVPNIQQNRLLHIERLDITDLIYAALTYGVSGWRALPMVSFALDHWRGGGLDAATFKTTNLMIHAITVIALAVFFRRLLQMVGWGRRRAYSAALLLSFVWAAHPLQVSSVLYVVQRMQTLCTLFVTLALWAYLGMRQAQMEGRNSRVSDALLVAFSLLALASKEDAVLLPLYMLVLELTVLQFRALNQGVVAALRKGYLLMACAGLAVYIFAVVPHYWHWDTHDGRVFSSAERMMTQGRILVMYLAQMLFPLPSTMPFNYDDIEVSRGWLSPWTTLPAWLLLSALAGVALRVRRSRPLFSFGVLLFFAGHFLTSNVIPLELAFEHRNHFPMIGVLLAITDLLDVARRRWQVRRPWLLGVLSGLVIVLGAGTLARAYAWGDPIRFAEYSVALAPHSTRAWLDLGASHARLAEWQAASPHLAKAISVLEEGAMHVNSTTLLSNIVLYKTVQGSVGPMDWQRLHEAVRSMPVTAQSRGVIPAMVHNIRVGIPLDENSVFILFEIELLRRTITGSECVFASNYALDRHMSAERVLPFLRCAVDLLPHDNPGLVILSRRLNGSEMGKRLSIQMEVRKKSMGPQVGKVP